MNSRDTLLLVDTAVERKNLRELFQNEYNILEAVDSRQAMILLENNHRYIAAVLLGCPDQVSSSTALLECLKDWELQDMIPVLCLVPAENLGLESTLMEHGAAEIICLPYNPDVVLRRVQNLVQLYRCRLEMDNMVQEQVTSYQRTSERLMDTLIALMEHRGRNSSHTLPVTRRLTELLLRQLAAHCPEYELDEKAIRTIAGAATLHDIGKITMPSTILYKPGPLTVKERTLIMQHTEAGSRMLESIQNVGQDDFIRYAHNICRFHHERWDGKGYPHGLAGDDIPICAQVVGLVDAYEALVRGNTYHVNYSTDQAVNMILNGACGVFSPILLECFKRVRTDFAQAISDVPPDENADEINYTLPSPVFSKQDDTLHLMQSKYTTLIHQLNAAVAEVDLDNGTYHLVYNPDPDLLLPRESDSFYSAMEGFARRCVHPEDQAMILQRLRGYMDSFFASGTRKHLRRYRIYDSATGGYSTYRATTLRIGKSAGRRALVVWEKHRGQAQEMNLEELILTRMPGSVEWVGNDPNLTLKSSGKALSALLGYTPEELHEKFHDRVVEMIYPEDRQTVFQHMEEQLRRGTGIEFELRMMPKNAPPIWVLVKGSLITDENGEEYFLSILVDINQTHLDREKIHLTLERHRIILEQTNDILFELDLETDVLTCSPKWEERFGYPNISTNALARLPRESHFHPEDLTKMLEGFEALESGRIYYMEMEARIANAEGRYLWNRLRVTAQRNLDEQVVKLVGAIIDIDSEKQHTQALLNRAERDALTELFNKHTTQYKIEEALSQRKPDELGALLIIDLDNFKHVNDHYGHMFGDAVLSRTAHAISGLFRSKDIVGRIGGDEFMVLMRDIPDQTLVETRCRRLEETLLELFKGELNASELSCSIGIALAPEHGTIFPDLFLRADRALYQAKAKGKNCHVVFDPTDTTKLNTAPVGTRIESDEIPGLAKNSMVSYVFDALYESVDLDDTIQSVLTFVGRQMNVSRVYIFENDPENKTCSNTYEWCNTGISPELDNLQLISYETDIPGYEQNFDAKGVFYCPDVSKLPKEQYDILEPQGVKSMLQCAIRDEGVFRGYVGFDECQTQRLWTKEQIELLLFLSQVLSVFLLKKRAEHDQLSLAEDLLRVLDLQKAEVYVLSRDTCRIEFLNAPARARLGEDRLGELCVRKEDDPHLSQCLRCPNYSQSATSSGGSCCFDWNDMECRTTEIHWKNKPAILITCTKKEN